MFDLSIAEGKKHLTLNNSGYLCDSRTLLKTIKGQVFRRQLALSVALNVVVLNVKGTKFLIPKVCKGMLNDINKGYMNRPGTFIKPDLVKFAGKRVREMDVTRIFLVSWQLK